MMNPSYLSNNIGCSLIFGISDTNIHKNNNVKSIDLQDILNSVKHQLRFFLAVKEVDLIADTLPKVKATKPVMTSLFQNLISNAVKFSAENKAAILTISVHKKEDFCEIIFADNGKGMSLKQLNSVFQDNRGLANCKKMLQEINGELWINSVPNEGTTVHLRLPLGE